MATPGDDGKIKFRRRASQPSTGAVVCAFGRLQPSLLRWLPATHLALDGSTTHGLASAPQSAAATLLGAALSLVRASAVFPCLLPAATELIRVVSTIAILNDSVATNRLALIRPGL